MNDEEPTEELTEESGEFVPIGPQTGARPPTMESGPRESSNIMQHFTEEQLKKLVAKCIADYDEDVASRADRMKKLREYTDVYAMVSKPKTFPFNNCANVMTPILTGPNLQIQARLLDMIWPVGGKILNSQAATVNDTAIATLTEKFGNAYVRYKMPEMAQGLDDTLHQLCLYGSAFRRTYWDAREGRVRSDWIPIEDFVVPHWRRSQDPSMRDVPRYTLVHHMTIFDLEMLAADGIYDQGAVEDLKSSDADPSGGRARSELSDSINKIDGTSESDAGSDDDKDRQVLEMHRKLRLPKIEGAPDFFDGRPHPVVITIDEASEKILRISIREEDDPDDLKRYNRELQEYQANVANHQAMVANHIQQTESAISGGIESPGLAPPPPPAEPKRPRQREICFFTHYRAFGSEGFYGLGYGDLLFGLAKAVNTITNQHIDGVTLRNAKPGFISRQARLPRGVVNASPGELIEVDAPASVLRDSIYYLDPPQNDPATVPLIELFKAFADQIAGSSDIMSGQIPGSNQTKAGIQILAEQAMMPITVFARRVIEAFRHELEKIWRCWGVFLPDAEIADIIDENGDPQQIPIGREMFKPSARVTPAADPRVKSMRVEESQQALTAALNNPFLMNHPNKLAIFSILTADFFKAIGSDRVIPLMQPPPPPQPPPQKPQYEENAGFLNGQDSPVHPADDHEIHAADLQEFMQSPEAQAMDRNGREMADRHLRGHLAEMIKQKGMKREQQIAEFTGQGPMGGPQAPGPGAMAGPPGNGAPNPGGPGGPGGFPQ